MPVMSFMCMYELIILFYVCTPMSNLIVANVNVYFFLGIKLHNNKSFRVGVTKKNLSVWGRKGVKFLSNSSRK